MENLKKSDVTNLFRLAATSMSAGVMLIIASTSAQIAIVGFAFCLFAFIALIAAFTQIFPRLHKFYDTVLKYNDELTILFILISFLSIIRNWVAILKDVSGVTGNITAQHWVQSVSSTIILIWLLAFALFFCVVVLFDFSKTAKRLFEQLERREAIIRLVVSILYIVGCAGVAHYIYVFNTSASNLVLFILSILITISMFIYLALHKPKKNTVSNKNPSENKVDLQEKNE